MKTKIILLCAAMGLAANTTVNAKGWTGQGEAGLIKASGNTDSENFNIGLGFKNEGEIITHEIDFNLYQASADNVDSAETLGAAYRLKYALTDRSYLFGALSYLDDDFDGFTEQSSISAGYGYKLIVTDPTGWDVSAGIGYRDTSELSILDDGSEFEGDDLSSATFVIRSDFRHQLTSNTQFLDTFLAEIGADNTYAENDAALIVSMNDKFSLKAGFLVRHNTDPAPGSDETDTITSINLVYNFQ